jgi:hypothetical protein
MTHFLNVSMLAAAAILATLLIPTSAFATTSPSGNNSTPAIYLPWRAWDHGLTVRDGVNRDPHIPHRQHEHGRERDAMGDYRVG